MAKLDSSEIIKLLDNLIGPIIAVGESNADERVMGNLKTLIDVTNWCIDGIHQSSETMGRPEYSMHQVGFHARCTLDEYRQWLNELFEDGDHDEVD